MSRAGIALVICISIWSEAEPAIAKARSDVNVAAAALNTVAKRKVAWIFAKAQSADVTCDGRPDTIVFGFTKDSIWMGLVPGNGGNLQTLAFPYPSEAQNGFSRPPTRISVHPLICDTDAVGYLDGCRPSKTCKAVDLDDGESDPFNFYWDAKHKQLGWWRN